MPCFRYPTCSTRPRKTSLALRTLIEHATDDELPVIQAVIERAQAKSAVLVTVRSGAGVRRYVVDRADEERLRRYVGLDPTASRRPTLDGFGCQWLRSMGNVDEMSRTLSLGEVVKVEEADRARVWGRA